MGTYSDYEQRQLDQESGAELDRIARRSEENLKASEAKAGMKVTMAGFPGTITKVCEWSRATVDGVEGVMVEVRLPGGIGCYPNSDLVPVRA